MITRPLNPSEAGRPLLVSDLDGTLLNSDKRLTPRTEDVINRYVDQGGLFTIATARMPYGFRERLSTIRLALPTIVMNGAALYSFATERYEHAFPLPRRIVDRAADLIRRTGAGAFVYAIRDGHLRIGYRRPEDLQWSQYNSQAAQHEHAPFEHLGDDEWHRLGDVIYIAVTGEAEHLAAVHSGMNDVSECKALPYRNVYTETDCLELASADAGKDNAIRILRERIPSDALVVFGDNYNDLDMMAIADFSYAPENAVPDALSAADEIIPSNDSDGVAATIEARFAPLIRACQLD